MAKRINKETTNTKRTTKAQTTKTAVTMHNITAAMRKRAYISVLPFRVTCDGLRDAVLCADGTIDADCNNRLISFVCLPLAHKRINRRDKTVSETTYLRLCPSCAVKAGLTPTQILSLSRQDGRPMPVATRDWLAAYEYDRKPKTAKPADSLDLSALTPAQIKALKALLQGHNIA